MAGARGAVTPDGSPVELSRLGSSFGEPEIVHAALLADVLDEAGLRESLAAAGPQLDTWLDEGRTRLAARRAA